MTNSNPAKRYTARLSSFSDGYYHIATDCGELFVFEHFPPQALILHTGLQIWLEEQRAKMIEEEGGKDDNDRVPGRRSRK